MKLQTMYWRMIVMPILCLVVTLLTQTQGSLPKEKRLVDTSSSSWSCDFDDLVDYGYIVGKCVGFDEDEGIYVGHGGYCEVAEANKVTEEIMSAILSCQYGHWTETDSQKTPPANEKTPPTFSSNCPPADLKSENPVPAGHTSMTIKWTDPTATDTDGSIDKVEQVEGTPNGGSFDGAIGIGRQHKILYVAQDNDGLKANCHFSFRVKVLTCGALMWPLNGQRTCTKDNILGSNCTFTCNEGYELSDTEPVTCQNASNPQWTKEPSCKKISCGPPIDVANSQLTCTDYLYSSYCTVVCGAYYTFSGNKVYRCEANKQWSGLATCKDEQGPELSCRTPQIFYAHRGSLSASVTWQEPTAVDRVDPYPSVIKTSNDIKQGVTVIAGQSKHVTYKAVDEAGNESPQCSIELRVQTISCRHPLDTLRDTNLRVNCSMATYTYGDTCTLDCLLNLPLEGVEEITCEREDIGDGAPRGRWDWGDGEQPCCKEIACPDIIPPRNGALVKNNTIATRPMVTMMCSQKFDIPDLGFNFNGILICTDAGTWQPNMAKAPDCIEPYYSRGFRLKTQLFYYSGTCGQGDNIIDQFNGITGKLNVWFQALCPPDVTCSAVNPKVECGPVDLRKRRSVSSPRSSRHFTNGIVHYEDNAVPHDVDRRAVSKDVLAFSCDIQVEFDSSNMTFQEILDNADELQLNILKPAMQTMVSEGNVTIPNWVVGNLTTAESGIRYCDPGSTISGRDICKPCPPGRRELDGKCHICPKGEYSDASGAVNCTKCPDGYSTRQEASESADNCTRMCVQGTYSPDTFAPCADCQAGFYQAEVGQITCNPCPAGKFTEKSGSTSLLHCQYTDVLLHGPSGAITVAAIQRLDNMTLTLWTKTQSSFVPNIQINVGGVLTVVITDSIDIFSPFLTEELILGASSSEAWIHVTMTWDAIQGVLSAYYRGSLVDTKELPSLVRQPLVQDGQLRVKSSSETGVLISGFSVYTTVNADVVVATETCHAPHEGAVVNMDHLNKAVTKGVAIPSSCSGVDACLSSPCGIHGKCSNDGKAFLCTCSGGWSGTICRVPPDYCLDNKCDSTATCVNGENNYTCLCLSGYKGDFCEIPPVDGGWSTWSGWSECSVSCNNGSQQRRRVCDSPTPGQYGRTCQGDDTETTTCSMPPCRECKELNPGSGTYLNCLPAFETGSKTCVVTCRAGYLLASGLQKRTLKCGVDTDFKWSPTENVQDCLKPNSPESYRISSTVKYSTGIPSSDLPLVVKALESNTARTPCFNSPVCETTIAFTNTTRRRKRNVESAVIAVVSFETKLQQHPTSDLEMENNETTSPALQEVIDTMDTLGATVNMINISAKSFFDVPVNGNNYTIDDTSLSFDGLAKCRAGQVVTKALCVDCPAGTYQSGDFCVLCDKNTYQVLLGQASCTPCPAGLATVTVGSKSRADCYVVNQCDSQPCRNGGECTEGPDGNRCHCTDGWEGQICSTDNRDRPLPKDTNDIAAVIFGISLGLLGFALIVVGVTVVVHRKRNMTKRNLEQSRMKPHYHNKTGDF